MKKIICCLLVAMVLLACGGESKKSDTKQAPAPRRVVEKRVGDMVVVGGELGVVFSVADDGLHGKVVSVSEIDADWDSAKMWCHKLGENWALPTLDDLRAICNERAVLNSALEANGDKPLGDMWYWSSEESADSFAKLIGMFDGNTYNLSKVLNNCARGVSAF